MNLTQHCKCLESPRPYVLKDCTVSATAHNALLAINNETDRKFSSIYNKFNLCF